jgi:hypothetical protein
MLELPEQVVDRAGFSLVLRGADGGRQGEIRRGHAVELDHLPSRHFAFEPQEPRYDVR